MNGSDNTTDVIYYVADKDTGKVMSIDGRPTASQSRLWADFYCFTANTNGETDIHEIRSFPPKADNILNVPYMSQWGDGADQRKGDCGPACIAMMARYLTDERPTVDMAAISCGQPASGTGSLYTNHGQLRQGAAKYGITLETKSKYRPPEMSLAMLIQQVNKGLPSIALIHYGVLRDLTNPVPNIVHNQDQNYSRGHWVLFIGYDDDTASVYIHDPDFWGNRTQDGDRRLIPADLFNQALIAVAPGNSVGNQGLIVVP